MNLMKELFFSQDASETTQQRHEPMVSMICPEKQVILSTSQFVYWKSLHKSFLLHHATNKATEIRDSPE